MFFDRGGKRYVKCIVFCLLNVKYCVKHQGGVFGGGEESLGAHESGEAIGLGRNV